MASIISATAHGLSIGQAFQFALVQPDDSGIDENTTYYVIAANFTANQFSFDPVLAGPGFVLTYPITDGSIINPDTYQTFNDGVTTPPSAPGSPSLPTVSTTAVSGVARVYVTLNDSPSATLRLTEVQLTHKFDTSGNPDWTAPLTIPMPSGSTEVSTAVLGSTLYSVRARQIDTFGNASAYCTAQNITTVAANDALWSALANLANDVPDGIITSTKIADNSVTTPKLVANAITADKLAATLLLASLIKTANSGRRIELDVSGITLFDTDESVIVRIPTNGDPVYVKGEVDANVLTSEVSAEFNGTVALTGSSVTTLANGTATPTVAPSVTASVDSLTLTTTPTGTPLGLGWDSGNSSFWIAMDPASGFVAAEYNGTTGALIRRIPATGSTSTIFATLGATTHVADSADGFDGSTNSHFTTPLTIPAGISNPFIDSVAVYIAGHNGSAQCRVGVWTTSNTGLAESATFTATSGGATTLGASSKYSKALTSPLSVGAGFTYRVGFRHVSTGEGVQFDRDDGSGKTTYSGDGTSVDGTGWGTLHSSSKPNVALNYHYSVDTRLETAPNIGICTDGANIFILDNTGVIWKYLRSDGSYIANSGVQTAITGDKTKAGLFFDATSSELIITTATGTGAGVFPKFVRVSTLTLAVSSSVYSAAAGTTFNGTNDTFRGGARLADPLNASAATYWVATTSAVYAYTFSGTTATQTTNRDFGQATTTGDGLTHDGTQFRGYDSASATKIWKFTNWDWTSASAIYWLCYAWYDSNATGGTHETAVGPRKSITLRRRERLQVQNASIPGGGGTDDPNNVRVYMAPNATDPGPGAFKLQATDALTSRTFTTYASGGAADGAGTAFPSGTPAELKSAVAGISLKGNGVLALTSTRPVLAMYEFVGNLSTGTGTIQLTANNTAVGSIVMPFDGRIVAVGAQVQTARTAGSLTAKSRVNNTVRNTPVATIDGTNTSRNANSQSYSSGSGGSFVAGAFMNVQIDTTAWTPITNQIVVQVYVIFDAAG